MEILNILLILPKTAFGPVYCYTKPDNYCQKQYNQRLHHIRKRVDIVIVDKTDYAKNNCHRAQYNGPSIDIIDISMHVTDRVRAASCKEITQLLRPLHLNGRINGIQAIQQNNYIKYYQHDIFPFLIHIFLV